MSKRISRETKIIVFTFCLFIATNLLDSYKSEHAPQVQSNFKVVESVVSDPSTKRIAFINGHHGTSNDFRYLSELLNFKFAGYYN